MAMTAFDRVLKHSIALAYVRLALGEPVDFGDAYDAADDCYMVRDMDSEPAVFHAADVLDDTRAAGPLRHERRARS
jgi:hypothetical protein